MKILISEKQLKGLIQKNVNQDIEEQDAAAAAGTSSSPSGGQGYPEVGVWNTGIARGPANKIDNSKMEDRIKERGKANKLK